MPENRTVRRNNWTAVIIAAVTIVFCCLGLLLIRLSRISNSAVESPDASDSSQQTGRANGRSSNSPERVAGSRNGDTVTPSEVSDHGPALEPKTNDRPLERATRSRNGNHVIGITPAEASDYGPAVYELRTNDRLVWSAELPFTLWDARLLNSGQIVGYAYEAGLIGESFTDPGRAGSSILVVEISANGEVREIDSLRRGQPLYQISPTQPARPLIYEMATVESEDVWVLYAQERFAGPLVLLSYRLSDGVPYHSTEVDQPQGSHQIGHRFIDGHPIPGTSLHLLHWYIWAKTPDGNVTEGAKFEVVESNGTGNWELHVDNEYAILPDEIHKEQVLEREVRQILLGKMRFGIASFSRGHDLWYAIVKSDENDGWRVESEEDTRDGPSWRIRTEKLR